MNDVAIELSPASNSAALLNPAVSILDALGFGDQRNVVLARLFVVAGVAKYLAILQGRFAAKAVRNIVIEMKLYAEQRATRFVLTLLARAL
jgi:hypothetical protein